MINNNIVIHRTQNAAKRGFYMSITQAKNDHVTIIIEESIKGIKPTFFEHPSGTLRVICIGHMYARRAKTFAVSESLELLAEDYLRDGFECMQKAIGGGMFALIIIDTKKLCLFACTDFLSCMPCYHQHVENEYLIGMNQFDFPCSDKPALLNCAEYLAYGYLPFHQSLFTLVHRIAPGQVLSIPLKHPEDFSVSEESIPAYPPLDERITDENEAIECLDGLFTEYFSRLGNEKIASGLSGGYDSRLIAAYCKDKNIHLVTYDNPQTNEASFARKVANALGVKNEIFAIPPEAPSRYADDFFFGMGTLDSLESSHVFGNLETLSKNSPAYIIDGHIGDVVLGGGFYSKLKTRSEPLWKYIAGTDQYRTSQQSDDVYLSRMAPGYGRKTEGLPERLAIEVDAFGEKSLLHLVGKIRPTCFSDADIMEMMLHIFRGALLASGGPVTFMRNTVTLCPFYDVGIFTACMRIAKSLRAGDRLYNAFYRRKFPTLSVIPKENTGGKASQSLMLYRLTHLKNIAFRKLMHLLPSWMNKGRKTGGDIEGFIEHYLSHPDNQAFFERILDQAKTRLATTGISNIVDRSTIKENKLLYLRYISLVFLLMPSHE